MAELEIIQGKDIGYEAIKKLDRNIKAVNAELEDSDLEHLAEQIKDLSDKIEWGPVNWKIESDTPEVYPNMQTTVFLHSNASQQFGGLSECIVVTRKYNHYTTSQTIYGILGGRPVEKTRYSNYDESSKWTKFEQLSTADKIDISSLCVNGWKLSEYRHGIVSKVGGCVIANLSVSGGGKNYGTVIFQLPQGYRPSTTIDIQAHCYEKSTGGWQYAVLHVDINGNVCVSNVPMNDSVVFTLSFPVA